MANLHNKYILSVKTSTSKKKHISVVIVLFLAGLFLFYCFIRPKDTGFLGKNIDYLMTRVFGITRFFIPLFIFYWIWYYLKSKTHTLKTKIPLVALAIIFFSGFIKVTLRIARFSEAEIQKFSGWMGNFFVEIIDRIFGEVFGALFIVILLFYIIGLLFEVSFSEIVLECYRALMEDINKWLEALRKKEKVLKPIDSRYKIQRLKEENISVEKIETEKLEKKQEVEKKKQIPEFDENQKIKDIDITVKIKQDIEIPSTTYIYPSLELLSLYEDSTDYKYNFEAEAKKLEDVFKEFDINAKVVNISCGPVVTMYEIELEPGVKVQQVTVLKDNIALAMKAQSIRIIAPLPAKGTIGIEIPNPKPKIVSLREILESEEYKVLAKDMKLPIVLGKTVEGKPYIDDIAPMPHLLIAGSTGSGKSICLHAIILSLIYRCSPDYLKLVLIDPKRLELMHYNGIPHLYDPNTDPKDVKVITLAKEAAKVLSSLVKVMEQRYEKFASCNVRNIEGYNELMKQKQQSQEFYIVVIIDEFADLILTVPKEVEDSIQRLAQMARAVGIHLVLATQRPSVDVITGVIKANFSARIAFQVLSKTDSRVILDITGAEELLGRGDMLYLPTGSPKPIRLQGAYVSDVDISNVVNFLRKQGIKPNYEPIIRTSDLEKKSSKDEQQKEDLYSALLLIKERKRVSQDLLKAHFRSSAKATDILSLLEVKGFIYKPEGTNRWSINFDKVEEALKMYEKI